MATHKLPAMMFYTGDWLKDPALSLCTPATRGVWIDLLCAMHENDRSGQLRGTAEQLARIARCSTVELAQALTDFQATGAAEIAERNGVYLVCNRRMNAEWKLRKSNCERQQRRRGKDRHGDVTQNSRHPSSMSPSISPPPPNPAPVNPSLDDLPALGDGWEAVVVAMERAGVGCAEEACRSAIGNGCAPIHAQRVIDAYNAKPGAWKPGLLYSIVYKLNPDRKVEWPNPSSEYVEAQREVRAKVEAKKQVSTREANAAARAKAEAEPRPKMLEELAKLRDSKQVTP